MKNFLQKRGVFVAQLLIVFLLTVMTVAYTAGTGNTEELQEEKGSDTNIVEETEEVLSSVTEEAESLLNTETATPPQQVKEDLTLSSTSSYPIHKNITTTLFWAGEEAGEDNKNISNLPSAWDEEWVKHFGGVDDPKKRNGYFPAKFSPKENPFYFALPYNDFNEAGERRKEVSVLVPWAKSRTFKNNESLLKNRWIKIVKNGKVAYAQWQDVGPFKEDDRDYVFGTAQPKSKINHHAGLDVSPAVHDYLSLSDMDTVDWQFVDESDVPDGPWKKIITRSQVYWK